MSKDGDVKTGSGPVLVTGASGPLGIAIATKFAKEGRDILLHDYVLTEQAEAAVSEQLCPSPRMDKHRESRLKS